MSVNNAESLRHRTKNFALMVVKLCQSLHRTHEARVLSDQLLRAGTAVAANYRAACRGRSRAEFIAKLGIVVEEADETVFWCEILEESGLVDHRDIDALLNEARELLSIFAASQKTARSRRP
ncbi:MAG: four helix bundle protein [Nitrospirae bacterium]|nr:four helix bundle protein [Nitrospirota bacterium]